MGPAEPCSSIQLCSHSPRPWPSSPWVLFASFPLLFFYPSLLKVLMDGNMKALSREVPHFYFWSRLQWVCHEKCGNNKISSNNENQQSSLLSSFPFLPITNSSIQHSSARAGNNNNNEKEKKKKDLNIIDFPLVSSKIIQTQFPTMVQFLSSHPLLILLIIENGSSF